MVATPKAPASEIVLSESEGLAYRTVGKQAQLFVTDPFAIFQALGDASYFDTGLLPPGVLSIRRAGRHMQVVMQHEPKINLIYWGQYEHDANAKIYHLAQPYQGYIGEYQNNQFLGARIFYSPSPISSMNDILYHQNVPNLNCKGYGEGLGVGWVCLYHRPDGKVITVGQAARVMSVRCSGNEAYNDANMSETDGPRFYKAFHKNDAKFSYLWDPKVWEKRSDDQGTDWTLNKDIWIPVLVKSEDQQDKHYADGIPLTLGMALNGANKAYYSDQSPVKDYNALRKLMSQDKKPTKAQEEELRALWSGTFTTMMGSVIKGLKPTPIMDYLESKEVQEGPLV